MSAQLRFPQGKFLDQNGYITLEWQQWLQNPQFTTAFAGILSTNSILNLQSNLVGAGQHGEDGQDGENGIHGINGAPGSSGLNGINGTDGIDGEDSILPPFVQPIGMYITPNTTTIHNGVSIKEWLVINGSGGIIRYVPIYGF